MSERYRLNPCACGNSPEIICERGGEDSMETWVECKCGRKTDYVEDAYSDPATAAWVWNSGKIEEPAGTALLAQSERPE